MRRDRALTRGRTFPVLLAGLIGYLIGGWHPLAMQSRNLSAAESVAQRFPQEWDTATPVTGAADLSPAAGILNASAATAAVNGTDDAQFALLNPEPMVPPAIDSAVPQAPQHPVAEASVQVATAGAAGSRASFDANEMPELAPPVAMPARPIHSIKAPALAAAPLRTSRAPTLAALPPPMNRPGYMLDDAQIASIKERLRLTPDQEQMWPAVDAALRNIAYERARQARGRGAADGGTRLADVDPESVAGLKSAAVPLIMSFNDEQKQEVRNLAHVMGLDRLASEF